MYINKQNFLINIFILLLWFLTIHFGVSIIIGNRGVATLLELKTDIKEQKILLNRILSAKNALENKTILLKEGDLDLDLLDEQARATLGYTDPKDAVIILE